MNSYERKQARRRERLENAAGRAAGEAAQRFDTAHACIDRIPPGQPILVGHHSEKRHRRALERHDSHMRKGIEASERSDDLARRAAAVGTGGISADDPDAVSKLEAQLAAEQADHQRAKALSAAWRSAGKPAPDDRARWERIASDLGVTLESLAAARADAASWRGQPVPAYRLSYLTANIRRIQGRIEALRRQQQVATTTENEEVKCTGYTVLKNYAANRVQVRFPKERYSQAVRDVMRRDGFNFSRAGTAWQRKLSERAIWLATSPDSWFRKDLEAALTARGEEP